MPRLLAPFLLPLPGLTYGANVSDRTDFGTAPKVRNITQLHALVLVKPSVLNNSVVFLSRRKDGSNGTWNLTANSNTDGSLRVAWERASVDLDYRTATAVDAGAVDTRTAWWIGFSVDFNGTANAKAQIYAGRYGEMLKACPLVATTDGSGATGSDTIYNLTFGNNPVNLTQVFKGIGYLVIVRNGVAIAQQMRAIAANPLAYRESSVVWAALGENGTGPVLDESGNGYHGANTGVTMATDGW